jgi:hypothetical protein
MVRLPKGPLLLAAEGYYRGPAGVEDELSYRLETDRGREVLSAAEFAQKYDWQNQPQRVHLLGN